MAGQRDQIINYLLSECDKQDLHIEELKKTGATQQKTIDDLTKSLALANAEIEKAKTEAKPNGDASKRGHKQDAQPKEQP